MEKCNEGSLLGCSVIGGTEEEIIDNNGNNTGILAGHAYSILSVNEFAYERGFH